MKIQLHTAVSFIAASLLSAAPQQPNIITIMVDDLGWNHISAMGPTLGTGVQFYKTPNIERLANGGLSFTHAYMQPNCAPTRAAMLSGQYPARIHNDVYNVWNLNRTSKKEQVRFRGPEQTEDVAPEAITLAEALQQNGYATAHIGKYHVGGHDKKTAAQTLPEAAGFDINIGGCDQGAQGRNCFATQNKQGAWGFKVVGKGAFDKYAAPYDEAYLAKHGFPDELLGQPKHISDATGDAFEDVFGQFVGGDKPFYIQFHTYAVHGRVIARPDLRAKAELDRTPKGPHQSFEYAAFIESVDLNVGRVLRAVEDPNGDGDTSDSVAENTLILFTSDNGGTHAANDPLRGEKGMFTEGGIRVPLIAYWPGTIAAGAVTDHMVHAVDYYPTYLELAGRKWMPPEAKHPLDGFSFAAELRDPVASPPREAIYYLFPGYLAPRAYPSVLTIDEVDGKRYKAWYHYEEDKWTLYNITDDVDESEDVSAQQPEVLSRLQQQILAWLGQEHPTWQPKYPLDPKTKQSVGPPVL
jgi:arylsulfatase A-like enzyme